MKIAEVAPLWENVPPRGYGGTERIIHSLTEGLVRKGFDVSLFACESSKTSARKISVCPEPLVEAGIPWTNIMYPLLNITEAFDREEEFDLIHVHLNKSSDYISLPLAGKIKNKVVFTLHFPYPASQNRMDRHQVFQKYKNLNYISISRSQRSGGENLNWIANVYNGIDVKNYDFREKPDDYLIWVGKFNPDKGVKEAVLAAKKAGKKLVLGGKIDELEADDFRYYTEEIKPLINEKDIVYAGELDEKKKNEYFGNALAFLNPIQWNEPFGLVMAESMAAGTPIISFRNGSASELIEDGKTGFLVGDVSEMAGRIKEVANLDRKKCRERVEKMFTDEIMTENYIKVFDRLVDQDNDS